jgi:hypothetical protein
MFDVRTFDVRTFDLLPYNQKKIVNVIRAAVMKTWGARFCRTFKYWNGFHSLVSLEDGKLVKLFLLPLPTLINQAIFQSRLIGHYKSGPKLIKECSRCEKLGCPRRNIWGLHQVDEEQIRV